MKKRCIHENIDGPSLISFFVYSPEIHLMSHDLSLFLEGGGGLRKTTLSPFKDVTLRLGGGGVKGKSDNVTLFAVFFLMASLSINLIQKL